MHRVTRRLTNPGGRLAQPRNVVTIEALVPLQRPRLVGIIQLRLSVVRRILTVRPHNYGGVVVLRISGPLVRDVGLLRVADGDVAVVLEGGGAGPERGNARGRGLKGGVDLRERLEAVAFWRRPLSAMRLSRLQQPYPARICAGGTWGLPEKAISGRTMRSRFSVSPLERTRSALVRLLSTSPTWGLNWTQAIFILGGGRLVLSLRCPLALLPHLAALLARATSGLIGSGYVGEGRMQVESVRMNIGVYRIENVGLDMFAFVFDNGTRWQRGSECADDEGSWRVQVGRATSDGGVRDRGSANTGIQKIRTTNLHGNWKEQSSSCRSYDSVTPCEPSPFIVQLEGALLPFLGEEGSTTPFADRPRHRGELEAGSKSAASVGDSATPSTH